MHALALANTITADQVYNVVSEAGYGEQFAAFDPVSGAVYTVYWTESGDLVGETAPTLSDAGEVVRDVIDLARVPLPLVVWFPAGVPVGWDAAVEALASRQAVDYSL
ncbi:hypothetical protein [Mycobacteroides abscessus]|uniref:hypothetical protein n=1 Tax=Mycobacteroides abscessus TaxID=36809 RepID=UPI0009A804C5|nr:hypothetical protein [Mycobacteroides abscessus]SKQ75115.1 Uncharacterised protein [Mycobacteroides abscessus subsp. massiliense]